jgi:uncharacterized protein with PIN domain
MELRLLGHDVLTSFEAGNANRSIADRDVLSYAYRQERIVMTNDRFDYRRLHRSSTSHVGIVEYTNDANFVALAQRIDAALRDPRAAGRFYVRVTMGGHDFR